MVADADTPYMRVAGMEAIDPTGMKTACVETACFETAPVEAAEAKAVDK
jgi:hypothetical protein